MRTAAECTGTLCANHPDVPPATRECSHACITQRRRSRVLGVHALAVTPRLPYKLQFRCHVDATWCRNTANPEKTIVLTCNVPTFINLLERRVTYSGNPPKTLRISILNVLSGFPLYVTRRSSKFINVGTIYGLFGTAVFLAHNPPKILYECTQQVPTVWL
jgi:hypothetical protein